MTKDKQAEIQAECFQALLSHGATACQRWMNEVSTIHRLTKDVDAEKVNGILNHATESMKRFYQYKEIVSVISSVFPFEQEEINEMIIEEVRRRNA